MPCCLIRIAGFGAQRTAACIAPGWHQAGSRTSSLKWSFHILRVLSLWEHSLTAEDVCGLGSVIRLSRRLGIESSPTILKKNLAEKSDATQRIIRVPCGRPLTTHCWSWSSHRILPVWEAGDPRHLTCPSMDHLIT